MTGPGPAEAGFDRLWADLEPIGRDPASGGYRRFAWTREDAAAREWFAAAAAARGLDVTTDRAGNQWGWWGDPVAVGPGVVVGSHLDSVPDGGAYDGPLGVISAVAALDGLRADGYAPGRPVGVVNFGDEEGARFGVACAGSRLLTGTLTAERALALRDGEGVTMAVAMRLAGLPSGRGRPRRGGAAPDRGVRRTARGAGPRPGAPAAPCRDRLIHLAARPVAVRAGR